MAGSTTHERGRGGSRWRRAGWGAAVLLLLLPLVAMQFTKEVNWTASDFIFAGVLLGSIGLGFELAVRRSGSSAYRVAASLALAATFLLVWINAAVGIIGNEQDDINMLYGGVLAVGWLGAIVARFRAAGLVRAMVAAALAQIAVPVIAAMVEPGATSPVWRPEVPVLTGFFAALWLLSAGLFRTAARDRLSDAGTPER